MLMVPISLSADRTWSAAGFRLFEPIALDVKSQLGSANFLFVNTTPDCRRSSVNSRLSSPRGNLVFARVMQVTGNAGNKHPRSLTISTYLGSKPFGMLKRARCCSFVTEFTIGSSRASATPGTIKRAVRAFTSIDLLHNLVLTKG
jgi:hypothetical protein